MESFRCRSWWWRLRCTRLRWRRRLWQVSSCPVPRRSTRWHAATRIQAETSPRPRILLSLWTPWWAVRQAGHSNKSFYRIEQIVFEGTREVYRVYHFIRLSIIFLVMSMAPIEGTGGHSPLKISKTIYILLVLSSQCILACTSSCIPFSTWIDFNRWCWHGAFGKTAQKNLFTRHKNSPPPKKKGELAPLGNVNEWCYTRANDASILNPSNCTGFSLNAKLVLTGSQWKAQRKCALWVIWAFYWPIWPTNDASLHGHRHWCHDFILWSVIYFLISS